MKKFLAIFLSLSLALFIISAIVSLLDDTLVLFFGNHILTAINGIIFFPMGVMAAATYLLIGVSPMVPKRFFLPIPLFFLLGICATIPFLIYHFKLMVEMDWALSFLQLALGLFILHCLLRGDKLRWPLVTREQLGDRLFNWRRLGVFVIANVFVLLPAVLLYFVFCAALAVDHFSESFLALHPGGLTVEVRTYARNDGKKIQLIPMSHIAEAAFYQQISKSFPSNSIILMEGVTDEKHLLTNEISYKRMAKSLGVSEQGDKFNPTRGRMVWADIDLQQFSKDTIELLNLVMFVHAKGLSHEAILRLLSYTPPANLNEQLEDDLLTKRNHHLLEVLKVQLPESEIIIVPWGVAHMPEIAKEIQKAGFHVVTRHEYETINFHSVWKSIRSKKPVHLENETPSQPITPSNQL